MFRLKKILNLTTQHYSIKNANRITEFLLSINIPRDYIIDSIYVILFDYNQVRSAYLNFCSTHDQTIYTDPYVLMDYIFDYLLKSSGTTTNINNNILGFNNNNHNNNQESSTTTSKILELE